MKTSYHSEYTLASKARVSIKTGITGEKRPAPTLAITPIRP